MSAVAQQPKNWFEKISLEVQENGDGLVLVFSWDENDPDLQLWTELGQENQQKFVLDALKRSCNLTPEKDL
jgi:hypothetical protein